MRIMFISNSYIQNLQVKILPIMYTYIHVHVHVYGLIVFMLFTRNISLLADRLSL